jgi:hypothetical protein
MTVNSQRALLVSLSLLYAMKTNATREFEDLILMLDLAFTGPNWPSDFGALSPKDTLLSWGERTETSDRHSMPHTARRSRVHFCTDVITGVLEIEMHVKW